MPSGTQDRAINAALSTFLLSQSPCHQAHKTEQSTQLYLLSYLVNPHAIRHTRQSNQRHPFLSATNLSGSCVRISGVVPLFRWFIGLLLHPLTGTVVGESFTYSPRQSCSLTTVTQTIVLRDRRLLVKNVCCCSEILFMGTCDVDRTLSNTEGIIQGDHYTWILHRHYHWSPEPEH